MNWYYYTVNKVNEKLPAVETVTVTNAWLKALSIQFHDKLLAEPELFLDAAAEVLKEEFKEELNVVEDAAHIMNQTKETKYTIPKEFTSTEKDEVFLFEKRMIKHLNFVLL